MQRKNRGVNAQRQTALVFMLSCQISCRMHLQTNTPSSCTATLNNYWAKGCLMQSKQHVWPHRLWKRNQYWPASQGSLTYRRCCSGPFNSEWSSRLQDCQSGLYIYIYSIHVTQKKQLWNPRRQKSLKPLYRMNICTIYLFPRAVGVLKRIESRFTMFYRDYVIATSLVVVQNVSKWTSLRVSRCTYAT